jgi:hypothetical protein
MGVGKFVAYLRLREQIGMLNPMQDMDNSPSDAQYENGGSMWSYADIAEDNISSHRVCESVGGVPVWSSVRIRVEIHLR